MRLCRSKQSQKAKTTADPVPVYETLNFMIGQVNHQKQDNLQLKDNIAYDYVHRQQK